MSQRIKDNRQDALDCLNQQGNLRADDLSQPELRNAALVHALLYIGDQIRIAGGRPVEDES